MEQSGHTIFVDNLEIYKDNDGRKASRLFYKYEQNVRYGYNQSVQWKVNNKIHKEYEK